jgi:hypothetical protein
MPYRQTRFSRAENAEFVRCLQQLQAEGVDLEIPSALLEDSRALDIKVADGGECVVWESPSGQPYYGVHVRLVARRPVVLVDFQMTVPWDDQIAFGDVREYNGLCRFGSKNYPPNTVLNSRIYDLLRFHRRGDVVEGWILSCGLERIPPEYRTHSLAPCRLSFTDSLGQEFAEQTVLSVVRTSKPMDRRRGNGLFGSAFDQAATPQENADGPERVRAEILINPNVGSAGDDGAKGSLERE